MKTQKYDDKIAALGAAIDEGDKSGIAYGNVFGRVERSGFFRGETGWRHDLRA